MENFGKRGMREKLSKKGGFSAPNCSAHEKKSAETKVWLRRSECDKLAQLQM
jgi:hypothetical protein